MLIGQVAPDAPRSSGALLKHPKHILQKIGEHTHPRRCARASTPPHNAGQLVRQRDHCLVVADTLLGLERPAAQPIELETLAGSILGC